MPEGGYKIRNKDGIYFITFAVVEWVDVFTRSDYADIVLASLRYCQNEKGLDIYAWCIMSNHVHMIISAKNGDLSNVLRDFKKFTSKAIIVAIQENDGESRRDWMLQIFMEAGERNSRNQSFQFWKQDNHPIELFSNAFMDQKLKYLHDNPVVAGIVDNASDYRYSSARNYEGRKGLLEVLLLE
ncbi:MAG: transposase [Cyclobacteriaceae bacterium]